ncbi:hypothetical protein [Leifsonia sp. Leaf264]|uniref:hypothetical protein n=1 Tax=Leifsonia sp. Leaf264 TaxID=1736314 RepID=UPI0006F4D2FD|nr:hypothetical protein [Leifsonia sp. Leaf264]KQO98772.1 hypothetical protein ASF30_11970 [Leifsonia sp. Leaf264]
MSKLTTALTADLTAKLDAKQTQGLAISVAAFSGFIGIAGGLIGGPAYILSLAGLFGGLVALRIAGPKDAKSFRLYRNAKAAS